MTTDNYSRMLAIALAAAAEREGCTVAEHLEREEQRLARSIRLSTSDRIGYELMQREIERQERAQDAEWQAQQDERHGNLDLEEEDYLQRHNQNHHDHR